MHLKVSFTVFAGVFSGPFFLLANHTNAHKKKNIFLPLDQELWSVICKSFNIKKFLGIKKKSLSDLRNKCINQIYTTAVLFIRKSRKTIKGLFKHSNTKG